MVEDDAADADLYRAALLRAGAQVTVASDAEAAVELVRTSGGRYHVCVIDLVLPGMRGPELVTTVRTRGFRGPLIGLSAHLTPDVTELWYSAGCDGVLPKGDGAALARTVTTLCRTFDRS